MSLESLAHLEYWIEKIVHGTPKVVFLDALTETVKDFLHNEEPEIRFYSITSSIIKAVWHSLDGFLQ